MIKHVLVMVCVVMLTVAVSAGKDVKAILNEDAEWALSIKPEYKLTRLSGEWANMVGVQVGPALERTFYLYAAGYASVNNIETGAGSYNNIKPFGLWYVGGVAEVNLYNTQIVHGSIGVLVGGGMVTAYNSQDNSDSANIVVTDPFVSVMINLTKTIEFGIGASYRFVTGSDLNNFSSSDLNGLAGNVFFRWTDGGG